MTYRKQEIARVPSSARIFRIERPVVLHPAQSNDTADRHSQVGEKFRNIGIGN